MDSDTLATTNKTSKLPIDNQIRRLETAARLEY
jgi:hypothetical protein